MLQSLLPYSPDKLRVLRLSNEATFGQISEILSNFDWSQLNQLEALTFDSIRSDELSKYLSTIHPLLKHLWRLSLSTTENNKLIETLLLDHIFIPTDQSLTDCFITGVNFDMTRLIGRLPNKNLRELTITLSTINDLIILFNYLPQLQILKCTIEKTVLDTNNISKIQALNNLTMLTLTIKEAITLDIFQQILTPHINLKKLSLQARFVDKAQSKVEIGGLALEKIFRNFYQLTELHFYFVHKQTPNNNSISNELYLFSFTSHFWTNRSVKVSTDVTNAHERHIYTLPFHFDTFELTGSFSNFTLTKASCHDFINVHHLIISSQMNINRYEYPSVFLIFKIFSKLKTISSMENQWLSNEIKFYFETNNWTQEKLHSSLKTSACKYIRNNQKGTHQYYQTLDEIANIDQTNFADNSKRVRQLTIFNMTEQQSILVIYFFPWIDTLTLHFDSKTWQTLPDEWLFNLLIKMDSLFSLTIYYPVDVKQKNISDSLINTLTSLKKYFFLRNNDGIVNLWF